MRSKSLTSYVRQRPTGQDLATLPLVGQLPSRVILHMRSKSLTSYVRQRPTGQDLATDPLVNSQTTFLEIKKKGYDSCVPNSLVLFDYTPGFRLHLDYHVSVLK